MNDGTSVKNNQITIPVSEADRLLACADGRSALLYLHILRCGGFSLAKAVRDLRCREEDIAQAAENLRRLGLLDSTPVLQPEEELPQYDARDITRSADSDPVFAGLVKEAQRALGKFLSTNDLRVLYGIYDYYGLPAEVILLLINHCIDAYRQTNGEGRMPTIRYIEKEARYWVNREIMTLEAAEEHIRAEKERQQVGEQVKETLQIFGRAFTASERKYVENWLEMGFGPEALAIAYDRTVLRTGKLSWNYMDKIVGSWCEKKLFTPEAIEQGDNSGQTGKTAVAKTQPSPRAEDVERMRRMYEQMKGKR